MADQDYEYRLKLLRMRQAKSALKAEAAPPAEEPAEEPKMSKLASGAIGWARSANPLVDEATAGIKAVIDRLGYQSVAEPNPTLSGYYDTRKKELDDVDAKARKDNPGVYGVARAGGKLTQGALTPWGKFGLVGKVLAGAGLAGGNAFSEADGSVEDRAKASTVPLAAGGAAGLAASVAPIPTALAGTGLALYGAATADSPEERAENLTYAATAPALLAAGITKRLGNAVGKRVDTAKGRVTDQVVGELQDQAAKYDGARSDTLKATEKHKNSWLKVFDKKSDQNFKAEQEREDDTVAALLREIKKKTVDTLKSEADSDKYFVESFKKSEAANRPSVAGEAGPTPEKSAEGRHAKYIQDLHAFLRNAKQLGAEIPEELQPGATRLTDRYVSKSLDKLKQVNTPEDERAFFQQLLAEENAKRQPSPSKPKSDTAVEAPDPAALLKARQGKEFQDAMKYADVEGAAAKEQMDQLQTLPEYTGRFGAPRKNPVDVAIETKKLAPYEGYKTYPERREEALLQTSVPGGKKALTAGTAAETPSARSGPTEPPTAKEIGSSDEQSVKYFDPWDRFPAEKTSSPPSIESLINEKTLAAKGRGFQAIKDGIASDALERPWWALMPRALGAARVVGSGLRAANKLVDTDPAAVLRPLQTAQKVLGGAEQVFSTPTSTLERTASPLVNRAVDWAKENPTFQEWVKRLEDEL